MKNGYGLAMFITILLLVGYIGLSITQSAHAANDPSPRFQFLGRELLETPNTAAPAKVFVYVDKATHDEIVCFSGENRETLSCYRSGRQR